MVKVIAYYWTLNVSVVYVAFIYRCCSHWLWSRGRSGCTSGKFNLTHAERAVGVTADYDFFYGLL